MSNIERKLISIRNIVLSALLFLGSQICPAQSEYPGLRGITEVTIIIEDIDQDAIRCGLTKDSLDAAVRLPLSGSRLRIAKRQEEPTLHVSFIAYPLSGDISVCSAMLLMAVNRMTWTSPNIRGIASVSQVWNKAQLSSGTRYQLSQHTVEQIEENTKELIAAWLRANQ